MNAEEPNKPRIKIVSPPESVPVYNCAVIVSRLGDGRIHGQVSNLAGIECIAGSEREVLQEIVRQFKLIVAEYDQAKQEIPWLDPPKAAAKDQSERMIPIHL